MASMECHHCGSESTKPVLGGDLSKHWWKCIHCGKEFSHPETLQEMVDRQARPSK